VENPGKLHGESWKTKCSCSTLKGGRYSNYRMYRIPELIPLLGSQPAGDVSHKPSGRLPLLSARTAVTLATLLVAASFASW